MSCFTCAATPSATTPFSRTQWAKCLQGGQGYCVRCIARWRRGGRFLTLLEMTRDDLRLPPEAITAILSALFPRLWVEQSRPLLCLGRDAL